MAWKPLPVGADDFEKLVSGNYFYNKEPLLREGYRDILKYGVAFYRKECMVKIKGAVAKGRLRVWSAAGYRIILGIIAISGGCSHFRTVFVTVFFDVLFPFPPA